MCKGRYKFTIENAIFPRFAGVRLVHEGVASPLTRPYATQKIFRLVYDSKMISIIIILSSGGQQHPNLTTKQIYTSQRVNAARTNLLKFFNFFNDILGSHHIAIDGISQFKHEKQSIGGADECAVSTVCNFETVSNFVAHIISQIN